VWWSRISGAVVLAALGGLAPSVSALVLSVCVAVVVLGVAAADSLARPAGRPGGSGTITRPAGESL
jgi:hypothetical protein